MKLPRYTLRSWLWLCVALGLVCLLLRRPCRMACEGDFSHETLEFIGGLSQSVRWLLWLLYCEDLSFSARIVNPAVPPMPGYGGN